MDFSLITGAITALSAAKQIGEAALEVRDFNNAAATIANINQQLLKAQEGLFAHNAALLRLQQEHFEATQELRELREAATDRQRYMLFELSQGTYVYRVNIAPQEGGAGDPGTTEPQHYVCQRCMDKGIKSVLQRTVNGATVNMMCRECKSFFPTGETVPVAPLRITYSDYLR